MQVKATFTTLNYEQAAACLGLVAEWSGSTLRLTGSPEQIAQFIRDHDLYPEEVEPLS